MTNLDILEVKREENPWLKELGESEKTLLMQMMDEARELGYDSGMKDAHASFQDEISHRGWK